MKPEVECSLVVNVARGDVPLLEHTIPHILSSHKVRFAEVLLVDRAGVGRHQATGKRQACDALDNSALIDLGGQRGEHQLAGGSLINLDGLETQVSVARPHACDVGSIRDRPAVCERAAGQRVARLSLIRKRIIQVHLGELIQHPTE